MWHFASLGTFVIVGQTRSLEAEVRDTADLQPRDRQAGAALASPLALPPSGLFSVSLLLRGVLLFVFFC